MITEPARRAGVALEKELPEAIIQHTGSEPGALPLMAFALGQLYERDGSQGLLTQGTYTAFGGVKEAIARRADEVFEAFAADHEQADQVLHAVFSELIKIDEQGIVTRQRAPLARLQKVPGRLHWLTA